MGEGGHVSQREGGGQVGGGGRCFAGGAGAEVGGALGSRLKDINLWFMFLPSPACPS